MSASQPCWIGRQLLWVTRPRTSCFSRSPPQQRSSMRPYNDMLNAAAQSGPDELITARRFSQPAQSPMDCSRYKLVTQSIGKQLPRSSNQSEERCMDGTTLQQYARDRAEELPQTIMGYPFGPDYEVYKIRGKVFMLLTDVTG